MKAQPNKDIDTSAAHLFAYMFAEREYGLAMISTQRNFAAQNKVRSFSGKSRTINQIPYLHQYNEVEEPQSQ